MVARENPGVPERVPAGSGQGHSCGNGFFAARGASPGEAGESQVGNGVPGGLSVPRRKLNSNGSMTTQPTARRRRIAWNSLSASATGLVDFSTARHRAGRDHAWAADHRLLARREHCPCGRGRTGPDPGHLFRRPTEHHGGIAGKPALKRCPGRRGCPIIPQARQATFKPIARARRLGVASPQLK